MDEKKINKPLELTMPWAIGLVITKRAEKINVCPITFQVISSIYEKPYVVTVGLGNEHYTLETIQKTGEFSFAYPAKQQLADALYCGTVSGHYIDKIPNTKFSFISGQIIRAPHLVGAVANFECKVIHSHRLEVFTIVVGEIVYVEKSNLDKLEKVYALGGQQYGSIREIELMQRGRT